MINTGTSQIFLPAKFHNFAVSGLFFIHKNKRVQFFMKHRVHSQPCIKGTYNINIIIIICDELHTTVNVHLRPGKSPAATVPQI